MSRWSDLIDQVDDAFDALEHAEMSGDRAIRHGAEVRARETLTEAQKALDEFRLEQASS